MEIIKIIGVAFIALIVIIILKQYRPEFAIYASIVAGLIILFMVSGTFSGIIDMIENIANKTNVNSGFIKILIKINVYVQSSNIFYSWVIDLFIKNSFMIG